MSSTIDGELRELGRPVVSAWLEHRDVKTLRHGDAVDLMVRVGAAIEAERVSRLKDGGAEIPLDAHPEDFCEQCHRPNIVWFTPSPLWNKAIREVGLPEILCPVCFAQAAEVIGISPTWELAPEGWHRGELDWPPRSTAPSETSARCGECERLRQRVLELETEIDTRAGYL